MPEIHLKEIFINMENNALDKNGTMFHIPLYNNILITFPCNYIFHATSRITFPCNFTDFYGCIVFHYFLDM